MRRFLILMILAGLLVAGCARHPDATPSATAGGGETTGSAQDPGGQTPGSQNGGGSGGQNGGPVPSPDQPSVELSPPGSGWQPEPAGGLKAIITEAPATAFQHHQIKAGEPIGRTGIFFMKTATGEVEGWSLGSDPNRWAHYDVSADNRWVSAWEQEKYYLLDRKSDATYQWALNGAALLAARGESLLFQTGSQFWIVDDALKRMTPVGLLPVGTAKAVLAPNGKAALLVNGSRIYLLDIEKANLREIGQIPANYGNTWLATLQHSEGVVVGLDPSVGTRNFNDHRIQRYDWTGKKLAVQSTPARPQLSPDGRLAAWTDQMLGMVDALVVGSGSDFTPRFRMLGEDRCPGGGPRGDPWLADSSGLVVRTGQGYQLLRADGSLASLGALGDLRSWETPVPAPDRTDRFAIGGVKVVDDGGHQLIAAIPYANGQWYGVSGISPWGETSDEVRFVLVSGGKDYGCLGAFLSPQVEKAPFSVITGMEVTVTANDCVNLRQEFTRTAPAITCMPNGTRLTGAKPPGRMNKGYLERFDSLMVTNMGGEGWWFVRTETGQRGWVMLSGEYLRLAAARPSDPPSDRLATLVADETANMLYWISVSAGETQCGLGCGGGNSWAEPIWALAEWCRQSGPGHIRQMPGFDPIHHDAGVTAIENGCKALRSAWETLGEPTDSPAWRQKVAEVKAGLTKGR